MDSLDRLNPTKAIIRRLKLIYKSLIAISIVLVVVVIVLVNYYDPGYIIGLYFLFITATGIIYAYVRLKYLEKQLQVQMSCFREPIT